MRTQIPTFVNNYQLIKLDDEALKYELGYIDEDGFICGNQLGAEDLFMLGEPIYSLENELLGYLTVIPLKHLNYHIEDENIKDKIPALNWKVEGYKGEGENYKTLFHLLKERNEKCEK